jgi:hypothetical protein
MIDALAWGWGNLEELKQWIFSVINILPIADPRDTFSIEKILRESIQEHLDRFITDLQSLILFSISKIGLGFRMFSLRKFPVSNNTDK